MMQKILDELCEACVAVGRHSFSFGKYEEGLKEKMRTLKSTLETEMNLTKEALDKALKWTECPICHRRWDDPAGPECDRFHDFCEECDRPRIICAHRPEDAPIDTRSDPI